MVVRGVLQSLASSDWELTGVEEGSVLEGLFERIPVFRYL